MSPSQPLVTLRSTLAALAITGLCQAGCVVDDDSARASGVEINQTTQSLTAGTLASANGAYGVGCRNRSGSWSLDLVGGSTLDHEPLSVLLNDVSCTLTLTELRVSDGIRTASPAIAMTTLYQASPSAFGDPVQFYGNAKLSSLTFAGDFTVSVLYSDDPALATTENTANFDVVDSQAVAASVPAPNYSLSIATIIVQTDVNDIVQSATGAAVLTPGTVAGQRYAIANASGLDTYAELDTAYAAANSSLATTLAVSTFGLVGSDLTGTQVRTLIIANIADGVRSYQAFEITFRPAL